MDRFCTSCGAGRQPDGKYCGGCGQSFVPRNDRRRPLIIGAVAAVAVLAMAGAAAAAGGRRDADAGQAAAGTAGGESATATTASTESPSSPSTTATSSAAAPADVDPRCYDDSSCAESEALDAMVPAPAVAVPKPSAPRATTTTTLACPTGTATAEVIGLRTQYIEEKDIYQVDVDVRVSNGTTGSIHFDTESTQLVRADGSRRSPFWSSPAWGLGYLDAGESVVVHGVAVADQPEPIGAAITGFHYEYYNLPGCPAG
jgi:hypothetical protein